MIRVRPLLAGVLAWVVGATASVVVGLLALSLIDADLTGSGNPPIAADPFVDAGGTDPVSPAGPTPDPPAGPTTEPSAGPTTEPSAGPTTGPGGPPSQRRLNSSGGSVLAECRGGQAYFVLWSPAPGYHVKDVDRGPRHEARVRFEGDEREVDMRVTCVGGTPHASVQTHGEGPG